MKKILSWLLAVWLFLWSPVVRFVRNEYKRFKGRPSALLKAIAKAKKRHLKTGKHYKVYFLENNYQVLTRLDIQRQKHDGVFHRHINATKLHPIAFFDTMEGFVSLFSYDLLRTKYSQSKLIKLGIVRNFNK